jgi:hypothetical protein
MDRQRSKVLDDEGVHLSKTKKQSMSSVVRIRRKGGIITQGCDVYIGRRMTMGGWDLPQSKWANPFKIGKDGDKEEVLEKYKAYILGSPLKNELEELRGKTLGCWCHPFLVMGMFSFLFSIDFFFR